MDPFTEVDIIARTTDTQSKKSENLGWCGRHALAVPKKCFEINVKWFENKQQDLKVLIQLE